MDTAFDLTLEESVVLLKQVLPVMSDRRVPAIPQNYAVWFDYITQNNPELCTQIDAYVLSGMEFTPAVCRDFYERFFLESLRSEVNVLRGSMTDAVECVLGHLDDLQNGMDDYTEVLESCGKKLKDNPSPELLRELISVLVTETSQSKIASQKVNLTLSSMSDELGELRAQVSQLDRDSRTDALTGISNRRSFNEVIEKMTADSEEKDEPLSLVIIDIDHFKRFNDTHGHLFGDAVIRYVAQEMKQCVKGRDFIARYGGEEFALLLPSTGLMGASMLAESIRAIVEAQTIQGEGDIPVEKVTISLGVSEYILEESTSDFINRADAALYHAKSNGRNKVSLESELSES
ncbi:MAG: GGDEF domain-containing protein [Pseudomonadales bacterium]|nr:GGDEF domain-containing protein [Pseudomonadales bacterium]